MSADCVCGHLVEHFGEHRLNCPQHPLRAEALDESDALRARVAELEAESARLREENRRLGEDLVECHDVLIGTGKALLAWIEAHS